MNGVLNTLNTFLCIAFFPIIVIQLYVTSDKIQNKYLRIAANAFPVFIFTGFILFMRYNK